MRVRGKQREMAMQRLDLQSEIKKEQKARADLEAEIVALKGRVKAANAHIQRLRKERDSGVGRDQKERRNLDIDRRALQASRAARAAIRVHSLAAAATAVLHRRVQTPFCCQQDQLQAVQEQCAAAHETNDNLQRAQVTLAEERQLVALENEELQAVHTQLTQQLQARIVDLEQELDGFDRRLRFEMQVEGRSAE